MNYWTEFDLYGDIVLILYRFCAKITLFLLSFFFKPQSLWEKIVKIEMPKEEEQTNNNNQSAQV